MNGDTESSIGKLLEAAINRLPDQEREALLCKGIKGITALEAAAALGIRTTELEKRVEKAKENLAKTLGYSKKKPPPPLYNVVCDAVVGRMANPPGRDVLSVVREWFGSWFGGRDVSIFDVPPSRVALVTMGLIAVVVGGFFSGLWFRDDQLHVIGRDLAERTDESAKTEYRVSRNQHGQTAEDQDVARKAEKGTAPARERLELRSMAMDNMSEKTSEGSAGDHSAFAGSLLAGAETEHRVSRSQYGQTAEYQDVVRKAETAPTRERLELRNIAMDNNMNETSDKAEKDPQETIRRSQGLFSPGPRRKIVLEANTFKLN